MRLEAQIIAAVGEIFGTGRRPQGYFGIGDDCAVVSPRASGEMIVTVDSAVEGVHFDLRHFSFRDVGQKALSAAASDIFAMNGTPQWSLVALAVPPAVNLAAVREVCTGLQAAAVDLGVAVIGGNVTTSPAGWKVDVTVGGQASPPIYRSGAKPGDILVVTGSLGEARAGLEVLQAGLASEPQWRALVSRQLRPHACRDLVQLCAEVGGQPTALIDVSDGLSTDLGHLMTASGTRAEVDAESVHVSPPLAEWAANRQTPVEPYWLHGGEDYELLFTCSPGAWERLREGALERRLLLTAIGQVSAGTGVYLRTANQTVRLEAAGWDPFSSRLP